MMMIVYKVPLNRRVDQSQVFAPRETAPSNSGHRSLKADSASLPLALPPPFCQTDWCLRCRGEQRTDACGREQT